MASGAFTLSVALDAIKIIEGSAKFHGDRLTRWKMTLEARRAQNRISEINTGALLELEAGMRRFQERFEQLRRGLRRLKQSGQTSPRRRQRPGRAP